MNVDLLVLIVSVSSLIIGYFIGRIVFRSHSKKQDKKILENAEEVLKGKRDNKIKIDGEEFDATKFRMRDEDDKEIIIDLEKGGKIQHGKKSSQEGGKSEGIPPNPSPGENSSSTRNLKRDSREKKRNSRTRRSRRFG